ncbi:membrane protein [Desulfoplanes formicivorans]|uniref:Membrane protein n=2 Tax=Desulfoplanes formicivorans TaxID=1592317 RepID=A0A194AHG7_9BACT|nr:membrane protein [Desulfoplanes formicivorans]
MQTMPHIPFTGTSYRDISYSIPWNLFLLTLGALLLATAINGIAIPHGFVTGGFSGLGILLYYLFPVITPGIWLFIFNIPIFALGYFTISRRFFWYSMYGAIMVSVLLEIVHITMPIHDAFLAALSFGCVAGVGLGICFRSLGSTGGTDIIAIWLNQKFGLRIGQIGFMANALVFAAAFATLDTDKVLYSLTAVFISAQVTDYILSLFNQRKLILIISSKPDEIVKQVNNHLRRGATILYGRGAYSHAPKKIIMTVVNTLQIKALEEIVFSVDAHAFVILENTLNVIGKGFSKRKIY